MGSFLANYGDNLKIALILWPMASAFFTLPILAYLYHRDGRLRASSAAAVYLAVLYVLGIGCFTLWPLPEGDLGPGISYGVQPNFNPFAFVGDIAKDGLTAVLQLLFNVVFFVPLGFIAGRLLRIRMVPTVLLALCVSAFVELAQYTGLFGLYPFAYRCCDVDDLIANTLGAWLGWLAALLMNKALPQKLASQGVTRSPGLVRRCVALWIDLSIVAAGTLFATLALLLGSQLFVRAVHLQWGPESQDVVAAASLVVAVALFVAVEVLVPWLWKGKTPGGAFVRMTCETRDRTAGFRALFCLARTATLAAVVLLPWVAVPVLGVFYIVARKMPYDYIPQGRAGI